MLRAKREAFGSLSLAGEQRRFEWEFLENPARDPRLPVALVLKDLDRIVAGFAFVPYRVQIGSDVVIGAAGIDLFVAASHRSGGLSRRVVEPFWRDGFCAFPFSTGLNAASDHLFRSCGGTLLGGAREPTAHAYFVEGAHPPPPALPHHEVEIVTDLPADYDALWAAISRGARLIVVRDAAYLRWRYLQFPFARCTVLRAHHRRATTGIAIVQRDPMHDRLYLLELLTQRGDDAACRALLMAGTALADASGAKILYYSTRAADQVACLRAAGFESAPGDVPTYMAKLHPSAASTGVTVHDWYVSLGDGDMLFDVGGPRDP
ncbi:MAG: hypothetical protein U1E76_11610 [Planctomycetota bacterium]